MTQLRQLTPTPTHIYFIQIQLYNTCEYDNIGDLQLHTGITTTITIIVKDYAYQKMRYFK